MSPRARTGAAIAAAVVTISTAVATASSADPTTEAGAARKPEPVTLSLLNDCEFPLGGKQVLTAAVKATLPGTVAANEPITFDEATLKLTLPEPMVTALRDAGIASVEGNAAVGIITSTAKKTTASIAIPKTALPDKGELAIDLPAKVSPEVKPTKAGTAAITVGPLETLLLPRDAKGEPVPDTKKVTCTLVDGQTAALGAVKVSPAVPPTSTSAKPPGSTPPPTTNPKQQQGKDKKPKGKTRLQDDPPLCGDPVDPFAIWTYYPMNGHVDVKKLGSGIDFGPPGYLSAQLNTWTDPNSGMLCNNLVGHLLWLPARGKFTAFEFMPTEATVTIIETAPTQGLLDNGVFIGGARTDMRMSEVTVNGTSLPVGPKCHTVTPVQIDLHSDPEKWNPFGSPPGIMEAEFTIPKFDGCGVGQDLDPLFNGLISGPGNKIRLDFYTDIVFCEDITQPCAPPLTGKR